MSKNLALSTSRLIAAAVLALTAPFAMANGHPEVNWSITVGSYQPAPRIYAPPVVYVQPQPLYVRPATVVQYGPQYYVEEPRYRKVKRHHWKHHHHRHYDD